MIRQRVFVTRIAENDAPLCFELAEEAAAVARVAGGAGRIDDHEQAILVAVDEHLLDLLHISAGSTLVPELLA